MSLTVAYSPCPNDTFLFHAWKEGLVSNAPTITTKLADVQNLNEWALEGTYPITKVSFSCLGKILDQYALLPVGAALGHGCGPMVISKKPLSLDEATKRRIAIPGRDTTAYLLLCALGGSPCHPVFCTYDEVLPMLQSGEIDSGLIIHETRFTFAKKGFQLVTDLGEAWEKQTGLPIPLGGIAARRDLGDEMLYRITDALQRSLLYGKDHPAASTKYILDNSQEKDPTVVQQHIDLYVTKETFELSGTGREAIDRMLTIGRECQILPSSPHPWLANVTLSTSLC